MIRVIRPSCLIALPLALAACDRNEPDTSAPVEGQILEGSVSDAMLPLDTVRSHPPLAPPTEPATPAKANGKNQAIKETTDAADAAATEGSLIPPDVAVPPAPASAATAP